MNRNDESIKYLRLALPDPFGEDPPMATIETSSNKPLAGVRILDFSRVLAGPWCTAMLADAGADVLKVESPAGDDQRHMGAQKGGVSVSFELINRNKRSLRLDLKSQAGRKVAQDLAAHCDVVVENFRPGVAARLGIDYATLGRLRPDLVYCSISGFGQDGPLAERASYDVVAQAMSGFMSMTGERESPPVFAGDSIGDTVSGLFAGWAICTALFQRERTGRGQYIDVAMFDSLFALLPTALASLASSGEAPARNGRRHPYSAPFGAFCAADGDFVLAVANRGLFRALAAAIGRLDLLEDARFADDALRGRNEPALRLEIESWSRQHSVAQVVETLLAAGIPVAPVQTVLESATSAHARHRGLFPEVDHPTLGRLPLPEQPVHFAGVARGALRAAPALGADGPAILAEVLGMDEAQIAALRADGVI